MTESGTNPQLSGVDFSETIEFLDSSFNKYMQAKVILSTIPDSTLRRHARHLPKPQKFTKEEKLLLHGMFAVIHAYEYNAVASAQSGADFASGLLASAACEALAIVNLIESKQLVKSSEVFTKLWKKYLERPKKPQPKRSFVNFLVEQRSEDLFRIAKSIGVYHEYNLPESVSEVLKERGFSGRLCDFVRLARNGVHPRWMLQANERYAKIMEVSFSLEAMRAFHIDFALCAWELYGRLSLGPKQTKRKA